MNSEFHKTQAEALIRQSNQLRSDQYVHWRQDAEMLIGLAQVHATLATISDE